MPWRLGHDGQETTLQASDAVYRVPAGCEPDPVVMARGGTSGSRSIRIEGEPDPETGTLADWERYRDRLGALPQDDEGVRLAIAVAEARIAALRHARRERSR